MYFVDIIKIWFQVIGDYYIYVLCYYQMSM